MLFAGLQLCFTALLALYDWNSHLPLFLGIYLAACAIFGILVWHTAKGRFDSVADLSRWILLGGVLLRITVFWCPPTISEDVYRYVWDGRVQNAGFGPYDYPPEAPELNALHNADYPRINHKEFRTAYPPAAQLLFRTLSRISVSHMFFKLVIVGFDILLLFLLRRLVSAEQLSPARLLIYAWHPLVALEFASSAHMDVIAISVMFLSFALLAGNRRALSGVVLAAAVLTKYLPVVTLPWTWKRGGWKLLAGFSVTVIILFIPYYTPDLRIFRGLFLFYHKWWFNDSLFGILRKLFGDAEPARLTGAACAAATALYAYWKKFPLYRSFFLINATVILFAPVVHPWYVLWLVPFLVFHLNPAWLFFSCWVAMSYLIRYLDPQGVWQQPLWLQLLVYVPLYSWLLLDLFRSTVARKATRNKAVT